MKMLSKRGINKKYVFAIPCAQQWTDTGSKPTNTMANNNDTTKILVILVAAYLIFGGGLGGDSAPKVDDDGTVTCGYAPTFSLRAADKWSSTATMSSAHQYKVNGGESTAYAGTAIASNFGDTIDVLWGAGNATHFDEVDTYKISKCGLNQFPLSGNKLLTRNSTFTITCFDENMDTINDVARNYSIGTGGTASVPCRLSIDSSQRGLVHGGYLIGELNGTQYKEEQTSVTGDVIGGKKSVPGAFVLSASDFKGFAYEVEPIMTTGYKDFTVYVEAENSFDPTAAGGDITLDLMAKDCYENSDTGEFECGIETEDNAFAWTFQLGSEVISVD